MTEQTDTTATRLLRGIVAGAVAGIVASYAMDGFQAAAAALVPDDGGSEPATEQAADAAARAVTGRDLADDAKPLGGQAIHYLFGAGLGIAYGVAAEFRPSVTAGYGTAYALGTATLFDEAAVPALGLGPAPWRTDASGHAYSYLSHLVFGGTSELVRRQVAATLAR
ncbi:MAG: DUF1440 domain-containing protein [Sphingomonas fennica]